MLQATFATCLILLRAAVQAAQGPYLRRALHAGWLTHVHNAVF